MENWEKIAKEFFPKEFEGFKRSLSGGRRPDAVSFTNIEGDVKRRDLTINALFYDIDTKEIVDLVGGVDDLKKGVVRTVGAPEDRFGEDRLRILRAVRFAGRFGSELDPATDAALQKDASLKDISGERIRDEFIKGIISAKSTDGYLSMIDKYKLFDWIFPSLNVDKKVFRQKGDYKAGDYVVLLARLLKNNEIDLLRRKLNELKYSADEIKAIVFLISMLKLDVDTAYLLKKMQQTAGLSDDQIRNFGANEGLPSQLLDAFEQFRLSVSGPEAMEKFDLKPGPELGKAIQKMETANFKKILGLS
jgi:tRNA nucleotidyltransferase/poly(A) polymerase